MPPQDQQPATPQDVPVRAPAPPPPRRGWRRVRNFLVVLALGMQLTIIASGNMLVITWPLGTLLLCVAAICHGVAEQQSGEPLYKAFVRSLAALVSFGSVQTALQFGSMIIADYLGNGFHRGRQMRSQGKVVLAAIGAVEASSDLAPISAPKVVADLWRENGRTEHASVAAFAQLTLELMQLGAPASLIAAAQQDGIDELRHTELCFDLARRIDGEALGPQAFPVPVARVHATRLEHLQRLAVDSLFDGALHEGLSARIVAKLARRCEVPEITAVLKEIAADEGRHAAHAWDLVLWCIEAGGAPVMDALLGALSAFPATIDPPPSNGLERYGLHDHALAQAEYTACVAHLSERLSDGQLHDQLRQNGGH